jgi:hypothetical protein
MVLSVNTGNSFLDSYARQINLLEADPNATSDYNSGLEKVFEAIKEQVLGTAPAGGTQDTPSSGSGTPKVLVVTDAPNGTLSANLPPALEALRPLIEDASRKTGVDPNLLAAMIWQESRGDAGATSTNPGNGQSDTGVMQINPSTFAQLQSEHPDLRGKSLSDPATNILAGAYFMADLEKQYGNTDTALRVYNSGTPTFSGIGDPNYITEVEGFKAKLDAGQPLPA